MPASAKGEGQYEKAKNRNDRKQEDDSQHYDAKVYLPIDSLIHASVQNLAKFQIEEKEWGIVINRRDVELVVTCEDDGVIAGNQLQEWIVHGMVRAIQQHLMRMRREVV